MGFNVIMAKETVASSVGLLMVTLAADSVSVLIQPQFGPVGEHILWAKVSS